MSIVAVHGPNMLAGAGNVVGAQTQALGDPANGLKFVFSATNKSRPAADYDWDFTGASTVDGVTATTKADSYGPITVVYAAPGAKTATLTVAAGAGTPAAGAYPILVNAVSGPR